MKRFISFLCILPLLLSITACGYHQTLEDHRLQVICSLFPYYDFVREIGGEYVAPSLLVSAGKESHSFEPTPIDMIHISKADVFIYNGGESEQWINQVLNTVGDNIPVIRCMMDDIDLLEEEVVEGMQASNEEAEDCDEISYDEHIWTSPVIAQQICSAICEALCQADPTHETYFKNNLTAYVNQLDQLDHAFQDVIHQATRHILVFGDRFPLLYFCRTYGLNYRAAFHGCSSDTEPSLYTLKYLIDKVYDEQIPVVYTIELSSQKIAEAIAETTGASVLTFYSCQTLSRFDFDNGETYLSLMYKNLDSLKKGLY